MLFQMDWPEDVELMKLGVDVLDFFRGHSHIVDFYGAFEDDDYV